MGTCKLFFHILLCCTMTVGYGLTGCGDSDDLSSSCPDNDLDGYGSSGSPDCAHSERDCDDTNADVHPGAPELCDGVDNQCPGDAGHGIFDEGLCGFEGGSFLFTVGDVEEWDRCLDGNFEPLLPPGEEFGPILLPGLEGLGSPASIQIPFGPPLGTVPATISEEGGILFITTGSEETELNVPGIGMVTATLTAGLQPVTASWIQAIFTFHVTSPPDVMPCDVRVGATGELQ